MPRLSDRGRIRALLQTDPVWAVYALGDLAPHLFPHAEWFSADGGAPALLMLYRGFSPPVLFAQGEAGAVAPLLDEVGALEAIYLHIRPDVLALLGGRFEIREAPAMWRMHLPPGRYRPEPAGDARRLGPADVPALERLYADGAAAGESPHFFLPSMVEQGVFFGLFEGPELVAAGGTHLVVPEEGVAAIGNIYTRRDRRGRGLAGRLTSAVVDELLRLRVPTVILNVSLQNLTAIRVYERLGFTRYCGYHEGLAVRPAPPGGVVA